MKTLKVTGLVKLFLVLIKSLKHQRLLNKVLLIIIDKRREQLISAQKENQRLRNYNLNSRMKHRNWIWFNNMKGDAK